MQPVLRRLDVAAAGLQFKLAALQAAQNIVSLWMAMDVTG